MDTTQTAPQVVWHQVTYFQVFKLFPGPSPEDVRVFNNGRQQCQIQVVFEARDSAGNPVKLSETDIKNHVRLIKYQDGQLIEDAPGSAWSASLTSRGFEWDESVIAVAASHDGGTLAPVDTSPKATATSAHPRATQTVVFHVSTTATGPLVIGAQISYPNSSVPARTNHPQVEFNRPEGDGAGQFNSSVVVKPVRFPALPIGSYGDFAAGGVLASYPVGSSQYYYSATEHRLHVNLNGRLLPLRSVSSRQGSGFSVYCHTENIFEKTQWAVSYYSQPNNRQPEPFPLPPLSYVEVDTARGKDTAAPVDDARSIAVSAIEGIATVALAALGQHATFGQSTSRVSIEGIRIREYPRQMFDNCVGSVQNASPDQVVIGLLSASFRGKFKTSTGLDTPDATYASLTILDAYGNEHHLSLTLSIQGTARLILSQG